MAEQFDQIVRKPLLSLVPLWIKPNHLTMVRVLLLWPLIAWRQNPKIAISIVLLSSFCDLLDGPLARIRHETSQFGAVLDATADKIFLLGAMFIVCSKSMPRDLVWIILSIDVLLTVLRPFKSMRYVKTEANRWGAAKVWTQTTVICLDLLHDVGASLFVRPGLMLAIFFGLYSLSTHIYQMVYRSNE